MAGGDLERKLRINAELNFYNKEALQREFAELGKKIHEASLSDAIIKNAAEKMKSEFGQSVTAEGKYVGEGPQTGSKKEKEEARNKVMTTAVQSLEGMAHSGMGIMQNTFSVITTIFERLKASSPLLQAIETLFNLAVQLFFMPLGTKLATEMLPAVISLVDQVMQIWDGFEGKTLGELFADTISLGAEVFGKFFYNIGDKLADEGGLLGAIGSSLKLLGDFVKNKGEELIALILNVTSWILKNLPAILGTIVGLLVASKALQVVQIAATIASAVAAGSNTPWAAIATTAIIGGVAAVAAGAGVAEYVKMAKGGYVPASQRGTPALIGEGGEGEYVVPESKKLGFALDTLNGYSPTVSGKSISGVQPIVNNYYNTFNGYHDKDILDIVRREISDQISYSRLKGGL